MNRRSGLTLWKTGKYGFRNAWKEMKFLRDQQILMILHQCVIVFAVIGSFGFPETYQCFTVHTIDGQTYNAWSATGWSSIHLTEKNFTGNTSDIPPRRYKSHTYLKSFLSILPMSHPGLIIPVRRHREEEKQRCKYYSSADHHQQKNQ